ncbi:MAG TPA: hypothetical protein VK598_08190 [Nitrospiraceae bacterium]|nr:hypothetical protein [Nitrospiraceae bacterium]
MENFYDILNLSFCQVLENLRRETARLFTKALLVWGLGMAVAKTSLRRKWKSMIVPSSLKKRKLLTEGIFRNILLLPKGFAYHAL